MGEKLPHTGHLVEFESTLVVVRHDVTLSVLLRHFDFTRLKEVTDDTPLVFHEHLALVVGLGGDHTRELDEVGVDRDATPLDGFTNGLRDSSLALHEVWSGGVRGRSLVLILCLEFNGIGVVGHRLSCLTHPFTGYNNKGYGIGVTLLQFRQAIVSPSRFFNLVS